MAGHSKFKNIMHRKGAQDKKRSKIFTKLAKEIFIAAKSGLPDPASNSRLRAAIAAAKVANMPKDRIDNAIKKASNPAEGNNYEEIRYEGYAPGGIAIIVEVLTDNKNRTAAEIRAAFSKHGGALGETGSVSYMFNKVGVIMYPVSAGSAERFLEASIELGAEDCQSDSDGHEVICQPEDFSDVQAGLEAEFGAPEEASITWRPENTIVLDEENAAKVLKMVEVFEDNDDVQSVVGNYELTDEIVSKLVNA